MLTLFGNLILLGICGWVTFAELHLNDYYGEASALHMILHSLGLTPLDRNAVLSNSTRLTLFRQSGANLPTAFGAKWEESGFDWTGVPVDIAPVSCVYHHRIEVLKRGGNRQDAFRQLVDKWIKRNVIFRRNACTCRKPKERNTNQQNSVVHQVILKCQQSMTKISSDDQCKLLATLVTHLY